MMVTPAKSVTDKIGPEQATHDLSEIPATALAADLRRRERRVESLQRHYERIIARETKLGEEIEAIGGSPGRSESKVPAYAPGHRLSNKTGVVDVSKRVLSGNML